MKNQVIRAEAVRKGVYLWEIAERFGVTDSYFSRKLRREFTQEETRQALKYIDEIAAERGGGAA